MRTSIACSRAATSNRSSQKGWLGAAGTLRTRARTGSAVDALLVALAEPGGTVLTGDAEDLEALAAHADGVLIEHV